MMADKTPLQLALWIERIERRMDRLERLERQVAELERQMAAFGIFEPKPSLPLPLPAGRPE